jgi:hypothetical protein
MAAPVDEINECKYLFLDCIQEFDNSLRLVVQEGLPAGPAESIQVGHTIIPDCTPIDATDASRIFEVVWGKYIGYSALNESYAAVNDQERYEGTRFRIYSKSHFIEYMETATFASDEYPGPTQHYEVVCENHIIDVLSTEPPVIRRVR